ncbi:hypothetical Protein YC6258_04539 [Gynuella sunshinyii YC6258]|uniref:Uncharacterized protein n=1 Tax=Gynuella sunshinyii YC6258 TaxID=1445510 RepID=A0A0C5VQN1_9GAMM|nr:hypothetical Protein YC6258_04539 [Gynuella sunshinyii YC6258]
MFVDQFLKEPGKIEDYGSFLSVTYEENWVELQFEFGCLSRICIGNLYDDGNNPKWPYS